MLRGNFSWWVWPQAVQRLGWMGCDCMTCAARPPPWLPPRLRRPRSRWRHRPQVVRVALRYQHG